MEELKDFERTILEQFKGSETVIGVGTRAPTKGPWIRGYLQEVGEDYLQSMFKRWEWFSEYFLRARPGNYQTFYKSIYLARRLGLVKVAHKEEATEGKFPKTYYTLISRLSKSPKWERLWQSMYPSSDWTIEENREEYTARGYQKKSTRR